MMKLRIRHPLQIQQATYLVKCKCAKEKCSTKRCQCRSIAGLNCTDLCSCSDSGRFCENMHDNDGGDDDDDGGDGDGNDDDHEDEEEDFYD